jgi:hypothetical protein
MRRAGNVARMGEMRNAYRNLVENTKGRASLGDQGVDGRIILNLILKK